MDVVDGTNHVAPMGKISVVHVDEHVDNHCYFDEADDGHDNSNGSYGHYKENVGTRW